MCIAVKPKTVIFVQHNYHDHAMMEEEGCNDQQLSRISSMPPCRGGVIKPFPIKLYEMLHRVEEDGHASIVSWQPHGRCFVVRKPQEFLNGLLPQYFNLSKIDSFQRQLNLWGFKRLTHGRDEGGYYHELFLRGKQFLANKIRRVKVKGTGVRARSNPNAEPNFWLMSWVGCGNSSTASSTLETSSSAVINGGVSCSSSNLGCSNSLGDTNSISSPVQSDSLPIHQGRTEILAPSVPNTTIISIAKGNESVIETSNTLSETDVPAQFLEDTAEGSNACFFEGRLFHCVDSLQQEEKQPMHVSYRTAQTHSDHNDEMRAFLSEMQLENLLEDIITTPENNNDDLAMFLEQISF